MTGGSRHETRDIDLRRVLLAGAILLATVALAQLLAWLLYVDLGHRATAGATAQYPLAVGQPIGQPPAPRLQTDPRGDLQTFRQAEDRLLTTYGWVDKSAGVVRIPIDRAMQLIVARGLPVRPAGGQKK